MDRVKLIQITPFMKYGNQLRAIELVFFVMSSQRLATRYPMLVRAQQSDITTVIQDLLDPLMSILITEPTSKTRKKRKAKNRLKASTKALWMHMEPQSSTPPQIQEISPAVTIGCQTQELQNTISHISQRVINTNMKQQD